MRTIVLGLIVAGPLALATPAIQHTAPERTTAPLPTLFYWTQPATPAFDRIVTRMRNYMRVHYSGSQDPTTFVSAFDEEKRLHLLAPFGDIAALLRFERAARDDAGWQAIVAELKELTGADQPGGVYLFPLGGGISEGSDRPFRSLRVTHTPAPWTSTARRVAKDVVDHLESTYPEIDAQAYSADLHDPGAIYWLIEYEDLISWASLRAALLEDDAYLALLSGGRSLFSEEGAFETMLVDSSVDPADPYDLGMALNRHGDPEGAARMFAQAVSIDPEDAESHHRLGHALENSGDPRAAIASFRRRLELDPMSADAHNELAWRLAHSVQEDLRDPAEALRLAGLALELRPEDANLSNTLGTCLYRAGQLDECIMVLERSIELGDGGSATDWFFLAMAYSRLGDRDAALHWYEQAIEWMAEQEEPRRGHLRFRAEAEEVMSIESR